MKKTFGDVKVGDSLYRMIICGIPHIRKETVTNVQHLEETSFIITDASPEVIVPNDKAYQKWMYNAVATNADDMLSDAIAEIEHVIEAKQKEIESAKAIITMCKDELKRFKKYEQADKK